VEDPGCARLCNGALVGARGLRCFGTAGSEGIGLIKVDRPATPGVERQLLYLLCNSNTQAGKFRSGPGRGRSPIYNLFILKMVSGKRGSADLELSELEGVYGSLQKGRTSVNNRVHTGLLSDRILLTIKDL
jgi:hypothetical protein